MQKPDLSIIMPGIRPGNWADVYNSIVNSTKRTFELIIISPYPLPQELTHVKNVKYVKDFGNPTRASCIGAMLAEGKYIDPSMADDALFIENAIDKNLEFLESMPYNRKNIVVCKYSESADFSHPDRFQSDDYYKIVNAYPVNKTIVPNDWWIFNATIWHREYFDEFGAWDVAYQSTPMAHTDLGLRAQRDGAIVKMSPFPRTRTGHNQPDHQPIEIAQNYFDTPIFSHKYSQPLDLFPIKLPLDNWKKADSVWNLRFK